MQYVTARKKSKGPRTVKLPIKMARKSVKENEIFSVVRYTASNLCLLLQKEQNVKGGEGPSGKQAVGINNGTR